MTATQSEAFEAEVASEIRAWMGRRRITQTYIAESLGHDDLWMSRRMRGLTKITVRDLHEFARILGCDVRDLLPRLDSNQQPSGSRFALVSGLLDDLAVAA